eukprot:4872723-Prymnesium_polylepis.1
MQKLGRENFGSTCELVGYLFGYHVNRLKLDLEQNGVYPPPNNGAAQHGGDEMAHNRDLERGNRGTALVVGGARIEKIVGLARFDVTAAGPDATRITLFAAGESTQEMNVATGLRVLVDNGATVVVRSLPDGPRVLSIAPLRLGGGLSLSGRVENLSVVLDVPVHRGDAVCELVVVR